MTAQQPNMFASSDSWSSHMHVLVQKSMMIMQRFERSCLALLSELQPIQSSQFRFRRVLCRSGAPRCRGEGIPYPPLRLSGPSHPRCAARLCRMCGASCSPVCQVGAADHSWYLMLLPLKMSIKAMAFSLSHRCSELIPLDP